MDSPEDFEHFIYNQSSSPLPRRTLKRLKKADPIANGLPEANVSHLHVSNSDMQKPCLEPGAGSESFSMESELSVGFEGLGMDEHRSGARKALDFDVIGEESEGVSEEGMENVGEGEIIKDLWLEESAKKRRVDDGITGYKEMTKRKKKKVASFEEHPLPSSSLNLTKKERRERLDQLRAESQRMLRETRYAAFKPAPLVQNPISSLLEKIRRRKQEISTKCQTTGESLSVESDVLKDIRVDVDCHDVTVLERHHSTPVKDETLKPTRVLESSSAGVHEAEALLSHESGDSTMADLNLVSQNSDSSNQAFLETSNDALEEVPAPSLLATNLNLDQALAHDSSEDEEDNDKENINPHPHSSPPVVVPVEAFVDEEAEEENDSDNDLHCLKDDEDEGEDEGEEDDDLQDMIITQYKEKQIDKERCNELHRKWLEQQDEMGTEHLLQRLTHGGQSNETSTLKWEEPEENEEDEFESEDEVDGFTPAVDGMRMTMKKIKETIPHMFTDKDDVYVSSDDEELEKQLDRQCLFERSKQGAMLLSPSNDATSKELFDRIKKVNNDENQKKTKILPHKMLGGNKSAASKLSFVGRGPKPCIQPLQKRGLSMGRSFIFERDNSNSRNSSEDFCEPIQGAYRGTKPSARFCRWEKKEETVEDDSSSGSSLYEVLKRSALKSACRSYNGEGSHSESSIFAAFKVEKRPMRR